MKSKGKQNKLPRIAHWILKKTISKEIQYGALGDFEEIYHEIAEEKGSFQAKRWFWYQALKSLPSFVTDSLYWKMSMLQNYLKVAFRKMMRQKVFSLINSLFKLNLTNFI